MSKKVEELCKGLTGEQIEKLVQSLLATKSVETDHETVVTNVNNENMASYSSVLSGVSNPKETNNQLNQSNQSNNTSDNSNDDPSNRVKPIFLFDKDVHGEAKPARSLWVTNVEIYKAVGAKVPAECIKGIQRIREMWRIYMDNEEDRLSLLVQGVDLRGRQIPLHPHNPRNPSTLQPDTIRIKVKNVPLSADDGQIHRALTIAGCNIQGLFRERLRVDGKLTNCETGDRLVISKIPKQPIPRNLQIGKYAALIFHSGQPEFEAKNTFNAEKKCNKCLKQGHIMQYCPNDWVCRVCHESGHRMLDCKQKYPEYDEGTSSIHVAQINTQDTQINQDEEATKQKSVNTNGDKDKVTPTNKAGKDNASKSVKFTENDEQDKTHKSQQSMDKFVRTPTSQNKPDPRSRTPPTPPEKLHDFSKENKGQKKQKTGKH